MKDIELLKAMVEIDTTNQKANESELADFLARYVKPYADKLEFIGGQRKNLIAYFGNLKSKNILCFNGHMDVAAAEEKGWETKPFKLTVKNGFAFGRGTADMKGGLAASVQAVIKAKQAGLLNNKLIILACSVDEETGADSEFGAKLVVEHLIKNNIKPQGCVIPEPATYQQDVRINLGHRGLLWIKCKAYGKAMHSGLINTENNAINNIMAFISDIQKEITNQPKRINGVPQTSCRVLYVNGGKDEEVLNAIPDIAVAHLDVRTSPAEANSKVLLKIQNIAGRHNIDISVFKNTPSASISKNEKIVKVFEKAFENQNEKYTLGYASPTCDAHWFIETDIPAINGLGVSGENVHTNNEFIEIASLAKRVELFYNVIKEW